MYNLRQQNMEINAKTKRHKVFISIVLSAFVSFCYLNTENATASEPLPDSDQRKFDYFFLEAINQKQQGNFGNAFNLLRYALSIDSTSSAALYEISNFYLLLGNKESGVEALQKAVKYNSTQFDYKMALANILRSLGKHREAIDIFEKLANEYPGKPELNFYLSDLYVRNKQVNNAIEALNRIENDLGIKERLSIQKYRLYIMLGEQEKGFREIEKLAEKYPSDSKYPILIGDLYLEQQKPEKALGYYEQAYKLDPKNPYYIVSMSNYYAYIQDNEASEKEIDLALRSPLLDIETKLEILAQYIKNLQQNKKELDAANALFETLLEQHPQERELNLMYGELLLLQEKIDDAKYQFLLVTEAIPNEVIAWKQLLRVSLIENKPEESIQVCNAASKLFPDEPDFFFYKGVANSMLKQYAESIKAYQDGLNIIPEENFILRSEFFGQIGDAYHYMKQPEKAYQAYEKALEYNDKNVNVLNNYAYFLSLAKKNLDRAERMSNLCIKLQPDNSTYIDTYAWIFFVKGNYTLAKFYIENAISKGGGVSAEIIDHYGDILFVTGEVDKAVEQWEKALELGKDTNIVRKKIADKMYYEDENEE